MKWHLDLAALNDADRKIRDHAAARVRAARLSQLTEVEARAEINAALKQMDDARGDMIRAFLK